jgi:prolyl oligopeptidase
LWLLRYRSRSGSASSAQSMAPSGAASATRSSNDPKIVYPVTKKIEQVDDYFGTKVYDPYRWLEDETSAGDESMGRGTEPGDIWLPRQDPVSREAQSALDAALQLPAYRPRRFITATPTSLRRTTGLQNQSVYYIQKGVNGKAEEFLDPNKFSAGRHFGVENRSRFRRREVSRLRHRAGRF